MAVRLSVLYVLYASSSKEQTSGIITFTQFEEGNLLSESYNGTESGDKSDDDLTLPPLISEGKMDEMSSGDESDAEPIPTDMV